MEYRISKINDYAFTIEKHMELNGFFRNISDSSKIGEIKLCDYTESRWFEDFLTKEKICYMELGCISGFGLTSYRGETPRISIGDNIRILSIEERIKFLYEAFSSNKNYNCLAIVRESPQISTGIVKCKPLLFEISIGFNFEDIVTFDIIDL